MNIALNLEIYQLICIGLNNILWRNILRMAPETETQSNSAQRYWHKKSTLPLRICAHNKNHVKNLFRILRNCWWRIFNRTTSWYQKVTGVTALNKRQIDPLAIFYTFKIFDIYMLYFKRIWIVILERFVWVKSNDRIQGILVLTNLLIKRLRDWDLWN